MSEQSSFRVKVLFSWFLLWLLVDPSAATQEEPPQLVPTVVETVSNGDEAPDDLPDTPENQFIHRFLKQEADTLNGHTLARGARRPPLPHEDDYISKRIAYQNFPDQPLPGQGLRDLAHDAAVPRDGPPGRWLHKAILSEGAMIVFGGVSNNPRALVNDVWTYDYNEMQWIQLRFPTAEGSLFPDVQAHGPRDTSNFSPRPPNIPEGPAYINPPDSPKRSETWTKLTPDEKIQAFKARETGEADMPLVLPTVPEPVHGGPILSETTNLFLELDEKTVERIKSISSLQLMHRKMHGSASSASQTHDQLVSQVKASAAKARFSSLRKAKVSSKAKTKSKQGVDVENPGLVLPGAPYTPLVQQLVQNTVNDLWVFNIADVKWTHTDNVEIAPIPRWLHSMVNPALTANQVLDASTPIPPVKKVWLYGGCSNALTLLNDVWELDLATLKWKDLTPTTPSEMLPREGHSAVVVKDNQMIVYGGMSYSYEPLSDMWGFDGKAWVSMATENALTTMTVEPKYPAGRWMHAATVVQSPDGTEVVMIMYGGCSADFSAMDDLWIFSSKGWAGVAPLSYNRSSATNSVSHRSLGAPAYEPKLTPDYFPPPARYLATAVAAGTVNGRRLFIHGGAAGNIAMDDMWMLDTDQCLVALQQPASGAGCAWTEVFPAGAFPFAREGHSAVVVTHPQAPDAQSNPPAQDTGAARSNVTDPNAMEMFEGPAAPIDGSVALDAYENEPEERPPMDSMRQRFKGRTVWRDLYIMIFGGAAESGTVAASVVHT